MTSKYLTILLAVAALLLTTSCSNDDMDNLLANGPVSAQVTASINNGNTVTRISSSTTFASGDVINVVAGSTIYPYTLSSSSWTSSSPYYFENGDDISFLGWSGVSTLSATDNIISIDTSTQSTNTDSWNSWDILTAPTVTANMFSPTISFTNDYAFSHIMSQVTFTFIAGDGISNLSNLTGYTLKDITTDATFNTLTCELTAGTTTDGTTTVTTGDITMSVTGSEVQSITCTPIILVPQTLTNSKLTLDVTYNDQVYTLDLSLSALVASTHYTFEVTINNTGLSATASIDGWTAQTEQSGKAEEEVPDYVFDEATKTYHVYTANGLVEWANYTRDASNENWGTNCTLEDNVDMSGIAWTKVGEDDDGERYTGTVDGQGYTISNLTLSNTTSNNSNQGFIGWLHTGGVVKNLNMANVTVTSTANGTGAIVGRCYRGTVSNCSVTNGYVEGIEYIGGIVGQLAGGSSNGATVEGCSFSGTVVGNHQYTGGIVGYMRNNTGGHTIKACYSMGTVNGTSYVGGVVGNNYSSSGSSTVTACYSTATVGLIDAGSTSDSSYGNYIGGVVGYNDSNGTITACYSTGSVNGTTYVGGVAGYNNSGTLTSCYWNNTTTTNGIGYNVTDSGACDTNATKVDGSSVSWSDDSATTVALTSMNSALTGSGWQYEANTDTSTGAAPLTLTTE